MIISIKTLKIIKFIVTPILLGLSIIFTNTYPEIAGLTEQATKVFANKIKRILGQEEKLVRIRKFAQKFDLVVFTNNKYL